jgi:protein-S-isoprenylcysteine O-methyltransferase Ste14
MSTMVIVLRTVSLLVFAGPILLGVGERTDGRIGERKPRMSHRCHSRAPVVANFAAFGLFFVSLTISGTASASTALWLAWLGSLIATAGAALVLRSRIALGTAWSFTPQVDQETGFVATGPYRLVRHPIYLGFCLLAMGEALAFSSWTGVVFVLFAIIPTLAWRARAEEALLNRTFGERYALYQKQTSLIIPHLL